MQSVEACSPTLFRERAYEKDLIYLLSVLAEKGHEVSKGKFCQTVYYLGHELFKEEKHSLLRDCSNISYTPHK